MLNEIQYNRYLISKIDINYDDTILTTMKDLTVKNKTKRWVLIILSEKLLT